jgi:hypothetical protein
MRIAILFIEIAFICTIFFVFGNSYAGSNIEDYELQERCGKRAEERFQQAYGNGISNVKGGTVKSDYTNHYNRKLNKCFIFVRGAFSGKKKQDNWVSKELVDINENRNYGTFLKSTEDDRVKVCTASGKPCNSEDEWDSLVKPYMEE